MVFNSIASKEVKRLRKMLLDFKIETRPFLAGDFSLQPVNKKFNHLRFNSLPHLSKIHSQSFALPCHQDLSEEEVDRICDVISHFLSNLEK